MKKIFEVVGLPVTIPFISLICFMLAAALIGGLCDYIFQILRHVK